MDIKLIQLVLENSKAVVIAGYGMGNMPTDNQELMNALKFAVKKGVLVAVTTQCHSGGVNDVYATGRLLKELGCVHTGDMTIECIIAKLGYLFGKGYELSVIKKLLKRNLKGEITKEKPKFKH